MPLNTNEINFVPKRLIFSQFFIVDLQNFCWGQIRLKFVSPSACRTLADYVATNLIAIWGRVIKNQDDVTFTFSNWLRRARAPTNCLGPPHTSLAQSSFMIKHK